MIPMVKRGARLVTTHPHLMANYGRLEINIVRGEGCWLYDESGNAYLDMVAGIAVCALGHAHPRIARAVAEQAATLVHVSNLVHHEPVGERAGRLVMHQVAHVYERRRLLGDRARDPRMRVPERAHRDPRDHVEIRVPGLVVEPTPFAAHDVDLEPPVVRHQMRMRRHQTRPAFHHRDHSTIPLNGPQRSEDREGFAKRTHSRPVMRVDAHVVAGEIAAPGGRGGLADAEVETHVDVVLFQDVVRFGFAHRFDRAALDPRPLAEVARPRLGVHPRAGRAGAGMDPETWSLY